MLVEFLPCYTFGKKNPKVNKIINQNDKCFNVKIVIKITIIEISSLDRNSSLEVLNLYRYDFDSFQ